MSRSFLLVLVAMTAACGSASPPPQTAPAAPPAVPLASGAPIAKPAEPPKVAAVAGTECALDATTTFFSPRDPSLGNDDAPVTIVEFADFQCPFCARATRTVHDVLAEYGPTKVRLVFKHEPLAFHEHARPAALAAEAVFELGGSQAFWLFHDSAFADQQSLDSEHFRRWAQEAGIRDAHAFDAAVASAGVAAKIDEDQRVAKAVGANGTPTFYVNGREIVGAQPIEKFREAIDGELAHAGERAGCARTKKNLADRPPPEETKTAVDDAVWRVPVGNSPTLGPATALVTIVEFGDFQDPFSKRVDATLAEILKTYGADVRLVWKDDPLSFHAKARPAAEIARSVLAARGVEAFWRVHDDLLALQPFEDTPLASIAKKWNVPGADAGKKHEKEIAADVDLADDVDVTGTPTFFVNGKRLVGAQPVDAFKAVVDAALESARGLVASGVPRAGVYERIQRDAKVHLPEKKTLPPIPATAPSKGSAGAKVVIQEFSDFQCPFCARVQDTLKQVEKEYPGKVRFVWRNLPLKFHVDAELAAEAAMEARAQKGSAAFWKMHDLLFENQTKPDGLKRDALERYAAQIGLDMNRFRKALDEHVHQAEIDADAKVADDAAINGTPGFVINGYFVSGAQPFPKFKRVIDRALRER